MNLPSLCHLHFDDDTVNFFNKKIDEYKIDSKYWIPKNVSSTINGIQTDNLCGVDDKNFIEKITSLKTQLINFSGVNLEYHWIHLIEYDIGGYQLLHSHDHNEDLSFILYLNTCKDGETVFHINEKRNVRISIKPTFGDAIFFLSSIKHSGNICSDNKRVLVCGLKLS